VGLEEKLDVEIELDGVKVRLYGVADRIDMYNGVLRVVDYKTGKVDEKDLKVEDMSVLRSSYVDDEKVEHIFSYGKFFQLMFYAYVYIKMKDRQGVKIDSFGVGIDSLRKPAGGVMPLKINGREQLSAMDIAEYEHRLYDVLREMINKDEPYVELGTIYYDILS
jgi:phosphate starvation-inducible protein PhoH